MFGDIAQNYLDRRGLILYLDGVPILDAGGLSSLERLIQKCRDKGTYLLLCDLQFQPLKTLARAGIQPQTGSFSLSSSLADALESVSNDNLGLPQTTGEGA